MSENAVVVLGASGMLGHKLLQVLGSDLPVVGTVRSDAKANEALPMSRIVPGVDALDFSSVRRTIEQLKPKVVVNCVGVVKQSDALQHVADTIQLNALFPHQLAQLCSELGARLIHFSTDCVFSGRKGGYTEEDDPDPIDLYGRSKLLGELVTPGCLTLRSSIVGWELAHHRSLMGWFASQRGQRIKGYRRAVFSGLSTPAMARLVADLIVSRPELSGLYHVASSRISKFDLLCRMRDALGWGDIEIEPDDDFVCDRSLSGARLHAAMGWTAPAWSEMIPALAQEWPMYQRELKG